MCVVELFSARRLASFEHIRADEVRALVRGLFAASGRAVHHNKDHLSTLSMNVITRMVLGKRFFGAGAADAAEGLVSSLAELKWMLDELLLLNGVLNVGDWVPWLDWMDLQGYVRRMRKLGRMFDAFMEYVIDEHAERRRREGEGFVARDMVDVLMQLADDPTIEVQFGRVGVKAFTQDLIAGGTESSSVTVEWAMSELLRKPSVFASAAEELDRVVGRGRWVMEQDLPHLPYLEAIVKELRHPQGRARVRQRVDHRQGPGAVARAGGVRAGEVRREQDGCERTGLRASAVRVRPADVPRVQPGTEGDTVEPGQSAPRVHVDAAGGDDEGGAEHGRGVWAVNHAQVPARGRRST
jgi:cytochrome P450